jgi:hypothetical protein
MTPSGIEPATFRFVAQYLNHCATISGPPILYSTIDLNCSPEKLDRCVIVSTKRFCVQLHEHLHYSEESCYPNLSFFRKQPICCRPIHICPYYNGPKLSDSHVCPLYDTQTLLNIFFMEATPWCLVLNKPHLFALTQRKGNNSR